MSTVLADAFADGCSAYNDGEHRMAPKICWRHENGTEVVAQWLAGWDFGFKMNWAAGDGPVGPASTVVGPVGATGPDGALVGPFMRNGRVVS